MSKAIDLSGEKFGRLTVLKRIGSTDNKKSLFLCKCECGNEVKVIGGNLTSGTTTSCGCYKIELRHKSANPQRRRLKRIYRLMKLRCFDETNKSFKDYGGRGITVCKEWMESFDNFYSWSISNGYNDKLTIDRINNDCNYEPSNCRWATYEEQANNTRKNRLVEYKGEKMSVSMFARSIGQKPRNVNYLIHRGYSTEQICERK